MNSRKDVSCRPLAAGRYMLTQPGKRPVAVEVFEDDATDLWLKSTPEGGGDAVSQRVDELAADVVFHKLANHLTSGWSAVDDVSALLQNAADLRQGLQVCEDELCNLLGCQNGDGSELADAISAAVRDGLGSSIELMAMADGRR